MNEAALIEKVLARRRHWIDVEPGKRIQYRRPNETETPGLVQGNLLKIEVEDVRRFVVGWDGITEADLLGEGVGADIKVDFSPALFEAVVADRMSWVVAIAQAIMQRLAEHNYSTASAEKNSEPS